MNDRNQPPFNPTQYPHQVAHGQPGAHPRSGQQRYQQHQTPGYFPAGSSNNSYVYPQVHGQPEVYEMAPAFPMAQGGPQAYASAGNDLGQYVPTGGMAPWVNPSQPAYNGSYYEHTEPSRALTPQPVGHPPWSVFPAPRSSTPQPQSHSQDHVAYQGQQISLAGAEMQAYDTRLSQPGSSGKFICHTCTSPHARKADLQRHIRSVHTQESPYRCLGCGSGYVRSDARGTHWKNDPACKAEHLKREGGS